MRSTEPTAVKICCISSLEEAGMAIAAVHLYGLDLCTGVRVDGRLEAAKLERFMSAVREPQKGKKLVNCKDEST